MIAPFWADADTRKGDGNVFIRETSDICQIDRAAEEIRSFTGDNTFKPTALIVATSYKVGYTKMQADKVHLFELSIIYHTNPSHPAIIMHIKIIVL